MQLTTTDGDNISADDHTYTIDNRKFVKNELNLLISGFFRSCATRSQSHVGVNDISSVVLHYFETDRHKEIVRHRRYIARLYTTLYIEQTFLSVPEICQADDFDTALTLPEDIDYNDNHKSFADTKEQVLALIGIHMKKSTNIEAFNFYISLFDAIKMKIYSMYENDTTKADELCKTVIKGILWRKDMANQLSVDNAILSIRKRHKRKVSTYVAIKREIYKQFSNDATLADEMSRDVMKTVVCDDKLEKQLIEDAAIVEIQQKHQTKESLLNALKTELQIRFDVNDSKKASLMAQRLTDHFR